MNKLQAMQVFVRVVETGGITRAADSLRMPKATATTLIQQLEAELGVKLLNRTTRSVSVTTDGAAYYPRCVAILAEVEDARLATSAFNSRPMGLLKVSLPPSFGRLHVVPHLKDFSALYPDIGFDISLSETTVDLIDAGVDVAIRIGALPDSSLIARRVGQVRPVVCASRAYLRARGRPREPADLAGHDAVVSSGLPGGDRWMFYRKGREIPVTVRPRLVVNGAEPAMDAAAAGLGVARVLSYQLKPRMAGGTLVPILDEWDDRIRPVSVVVPAGRFMPAKVRAFIDLAARVLPTRL